MINWLPDVRENKRIDPFHKGENYKIKLILSLNLCLRLRGIKIHHLKVSGKQQGQCEGATCQWDTITLPLLAFALHTRARMGGYAVGIPYGAAVVGAGEDSEKNNPLLWREDKIILSPLALAQNQIDQSSFHFHPIV